MQLTTNYGFKKPEGNDNVNVDDLNYNMDIADTELKKVNEHLDEKVNKTELIAKLKKIKSGTPVDNIYPVVTYKRSDDTIYKISTLSGGVAPQWTTRTVVYYASDGITIEKTDIFTLTYDVDGNILSEV